MKLRTSNRRNDALTLIEVFVVAVVCSALMILILPGIMRRPNGGQKINCVNNLKQVGLAFRIWEGDNADKFPMQVSLKQGGAMELAITGNVARIFQVMSNELSTPKVLYCPQDASHQSATEFAPHFGTKNISYFVGLDAADKYPAAFLSGDDNFEIKRKPVNPGVLEVATNTPLTWSAARHRFTGNIGLADGSVLTTTDSLLKNAIINQYQSSPDFTNRFRAAIP